jgi:hypothetical protein
MIKMIIFVDWNPGFMVAHGYPARVSPEFVEGLRKIQGLKTAPSSRALIHSRKLKLPK